jgi:uncharacterized protein with GYD domain
VIAVLGGFERLRPAEPLTAPDGKAIAVANKESILHVDWDAPAPIRAPQESRLAPIHPAWEPVARPTPDYEDEEMPKYLFQASYTTQGEEGVRAKGGSDRRDAVADAVKSVGGELECLYVEFGDRDAFSIVDLPDDEAAAALSLIANASGGATVRTTVLLTPEQVDEAANRAVTFRPPGL